MLIESGATQRRELKNKAGNCRYTKKEKLIPQESIDKVWSVKYHGEALRHMGRADWGTKLMGSC